MRGIPEEEWEMMNWDEVSPEVYWGKEGKDPNKEGFTITDMENENKQRVYMAAIGGGEAKVEGVGWMPPKMAATPFTPVGRKGAPVRTSEAKAEAPVAATDPE
eukprot:g36239.t1